MKVSRICLGTMTFSREADEATSFAIMDAFVEAGGNFLDTANAYSHGASEATVGAWMADRGNRQDVIVATKVYGRMGDGPNDAGLSRLHILRAVEGSLRRLRTDAIDLYQIHRWDPETPPAETLRALDDLVRRGKVRYIGCSNLRAFQIDYFLRYADENLLSRFVSLQPHYNALNRSIELEVLPLCEREGLGVIPYNPLAGGMLTGKYRRGQDLPAGARLDAYDTYNRRYYTDQALDIVERFLEAAREREMTPAQLALAWVLAESRITSPILGARTVEQLRDSLGALERPLTPEEREQVPAIPPGRWVGQDPLYR
jgi:aryl-alcohol dehydrogenase-like predicted oxidoreductase